VVGILITTVISLAGWAYSDLRGQIVDLKSSVDALTRTVDRANFLDSLQSDDVKVMRGYLHTHTSPAAVGVVTIYPEGYR
jgi:hypothetical protein